jgi:hypothetical protein
MLTADPTEFYSDPLYAARSVLLDDLDAFKVEAAAGLYTIRPFKREKMVPVVDNMIATVMAATEQSIQAQMPKVEGAVSAQATDATARMYLAAVGAGTALTLLLVAAARRFG